MGRRQRLAESYPSGRTPRRCWAGHRVERSPKSPRRTPPGDNLRAEDAIHRVKRIVEPVLRRRPGDQPRPGVGPSSPAASPWAQSASPPRPPSPLGAGPGGRHLARRNRRRGPAQPLRRGHRRRPPGRPPRRRDGALKRRNRDRPRPGEHRAPGGRRRTPLASARDPTTPAPVQGRDRPGLAAWASTPIGPTPESLAAPAVGPAGTPEGPATLDVDPSDADPADTSPALMGGAGVFDSSPVSSLASGETGTHDVPPGGTLGAAPGSGTEAGGGRARSCRRTR